MNSIIIKVSLADKTREGIKFTRQSLGVDSKNIKTLIHILSLGSMKNHTVDVPSLTLTYVPSAQKTSTVCKFQVAYFLPQSLYTFLVMYVTTKDLTLAAFSLVALPRYVEYSSPASYSSLHNLKKTLASKRNLTDLYLGHCFVIIVIFNLRGCTLLTRSSAGSFTSLQQI
jgi:hypothetical protein